MRYIVLLSMATLFLDYVTDWNRVRNFYPQNYSFESILAYARHRPALDAAHRGKLCAALSDQHKLWGGGTASIERLCSGAVAVIAGQQPGLFTGPLYTIFKALTAIKLAEHLRAQGVNAVPMFWVAGEDHDFEEVNHTRLLNREGQVVIAPRVVSRRPKPCPASA